MSFSLSASGKGRHSYQQCFRERRAQLPTLLSIRGHFSSSFPSKAENIITKSKNETKAKPFHQVKNCSIPGRFLLFFVIIMEFLLVSPSQPV